MNEKKAKRLRRELFTYDQWLYEKANVKYVRATDVRGNELPFIIRTSAMLNKYHENKGLSYGREAHR